MHALIQSWTPYAQPNALSAGILSFRMNHNEIGTVAETTVELNTGKIDPAPTKKPSIDFDANFGIHANVDKIQ